MKDIIALRREMLRDETFRSLCIDNGLPWDVTAGYEPRWYYGPHPSNVKVLFFMAEPGPVTPTEQFNLLPPVGHPSWLSGHSLDSQEHYWRRNLYTMCQAIWPDDTMQMMNSYLAGTCTFWMSLPHGQVTVHSSRRRTLLYRQVFSTTTRPISICGHYRGWGEVTGPTKEVVNAFSSLLGIYSPRV